MILPSLHVCVCENGVYPKSPKKHGEHDNESLAFWVLDFLHGQLPRALTETFGFSPTRLTAPRSAAEVSPVFNRDRGAPWSTTSMTFNILIHTYINHN